MKNNWVYIRGKLTIGDDGTGCWGNFELYREMNLNVSEQKMCNASSCTRTQEILFVTSLDSTRCYSMHNEFKNS